MTIEKKLLAIMEGKTDLVEYHMKGTVNGKPFTACCDDVYNPDDILAQNPHLSADEAKAVHDHTETDNFIDGYSGTEGLHGGHLVKISSNGGYHGDKTDMQNKIAKLSEGKDDPYASNRDEYARGFAKDWKTATQSKMSGYKASKLYHTSELKPNHVYTYDNHGDDVYHGDNVRHFKVLSKNEDGSVTAHPVLPSNHNFDLVPGTKPFTMKSGEIDGMPESNRYSTSSVYSLTSPKFEFDDDDDELSDHRGNFNHIRNPFNESKAEKKDDATDGSDAEGKADQVVDEPAVTIENPLDPALAGSDADDQNPGSKDGEKIEESADSTKILDTDSLSVHQIHTHAGACEHGSGTDWCTADKKSPRLFNHYNDRGPLFVINDKKAGKKYQYHNATKTFLDDKDKSQDLEEFSRKNPDINQVKDRLIGKVQESTELSEEFQAQAKALFESKLAEEVEKIVNERTESFEATYTQKLEESVSEFERNLIEQIDGYFDVLSEQWMRDNELALEAGTRSSLTESFMESIKKVFDAHYIDFPVEKIDIVESMEKTQDELKDEIVQLKLALDEKAQMLEDTKREIIMENATKGMTEIDAIKLKTLVEELGPTSNEELTKRLSSLKESVFGSGKKIEIDQSKLNLSSKPLVEDAEIKKPSETRVSKYADHIRKSTTTRK